MNDKFLMNSFFGWIKESVSCIYLLFLLWCTVNKQYKEQFEHSELPMCSFKTYCYNGHFSPLRPNSVKIRDIALIDRKEHPWIHLVFRPIADYYLHIGSLKINLIFCFIMNEIFLVFSSFPLSIWIILQINGKIFQFF